MSDKAKQLIEDICPQCGYKGDDSEFDDVEWDDHDNDFADEPYDDTLSVATEPEDDFEDDFEDDEVYSDDDDFAEPKEPSFVTPNAPYGANTVSPGDVSTDNDYYFDDEDSPEQSVW